MTVESDKYVAWQELHMFQLTISDIVNSNIQIPIEKVVNDSFQIRSKVQHMTLGIQWVSHLSTRTAETKTSLQERLWFQSVEFINSILQHVATCMRRFR